MNIQEQAAGFIAEYNQQLTTLTERMDETGQRLEDLALEIQFIQEKEIPEAVQRRVLTGDRLQENKVRKLLAKLEAEKAEKSEDLTVLQNVITNFKRKKADEMKQLFRLFQEEKNMVGVEQLEKMAAAKEAYKQAIRKASEPLHEYRKIEADLQRIEQAAGRRSYVQAVIPVYDLDIIKLSIERPEITRLLKG